MPRMAMDSVTLATLSDGYLAMVVDKEIQRIVTDLQQRGHDGAKRRLKIELVFEDKGGGKIDVQPKVQAVLPPYLPPSTDAKLNPKDGRLEFRDDSGANADQTTFRDLPGGELPPDAE